jgi:hypothetical protein
LVRISTSFFINATPILIDQQARYITWSVVGPCQESLVMMADAAARAISSWILLSMTVLVPSVLKHTRSIDKCAVNHGVIYIPCSTQMNNSTNNNTLLPQHTDQSSDNGVFVFCRTFHDDNVSSHQQKVEVDFLSGTTALTTVADGLAIAFFQ